MTLLSAVVLGTDVFAVPHRGLPRTGVFVVLCEQVSVRLLSGKSHTLLGVLGQEEDLLAQVFYNMVCVRVCVCVWTIKFGLGMQTP